MIELSFLEMEDFGLFRVVRAHPKGKGGVGLEGVGWVDYISKARLVQTYRKRGLLIDALRS